MPRRYGSATWVSLPISSAGIIWYFHIWNSVSCRMLFCWHPSQRFTKQMIPYTYVVDDRNCIHLWASAFCHAFFSQGCSHSHSSPADAILHHHLSPPLLRGEHQLAAYSHRTRALQHVGPCLCVSFRSFGPAGFVCLLFWEIQCCAMAFNSPGMLCWRSVSFASMALHITRALLSYRKSPSWSRVVSRITRSTRRSLSTLAFWYARHSHAQRTCFMAPVSCMCSETTGGQ